MILYTIFILGGLTSGYDTNPSSFLKKKTDQFSIGVWDKLEKKSYHTEFLQHCSREAINKDPSILGYTGDYIYYFNYKEKSKEYGLTMRCAIFESDAQNIFIPLWHSLKITELPAKIYEQVNFHRNKKPGDRWYEKDKRNS